MPETKKLFSSLEDYWWYLQKHRRQYAEKQGLQPALVPLRKSFDPMQIPSVLPFVSLLERMEDGKTVVRLRGTELEQLLPKAGPNDDVESLVSSEQWLSFVKLHDAVLTQPCALYLDNRITLHSGLTFNAQRISLPLADRTGQVRFVINVGIPERHYASSPLQNMQVASIKILSIAYRDIGYGVPDIKVAVPECDIIFQ